MTFQFTDLPQRTVARIAGLGYLTIIVAGIFAEFYVRAGLIVPGDASATVGNITASGSLPRIGIAADLVMLIADAVVALALYVLFANTDKTLALLATFFRLVHTAVVGASLINLVLVLLLLGSAGAMAAFTGEQIQSLVMVFLDAHSVGYILGLVFFAVHCLALGFLVYKSDLFPRILGVLLIIASAGYMIDSFARILMTSYADHKDIFEPIVLVPAIVAELSFTIWLLVKGVKAVKRINS